MVTGKKAAGNRAAMKRSSAVLTIALFSCTSPAPQEQIRETAVTALEATGTAAPSPPLEERVGVRYATRLLYVNDGHAYLRTSDSEVDRLFPADAVRFGSTPSQIYALNGEDVTVHNVDTGSVMETSYPSLPVGSPDGNRILVAEGKSLVFINLDGTHGRVEGEDPIWIDSDRFLAKRDGNLLVVDLGQEGGSYIASDVNVYDVHGGGAIFTATRGPFSKGFGLGFTPGQMVENAGKSFGRNLLASVDLTTGTVTELHAEEIIPYSLQGNRVVRNGVDFFYDVSVSPDGSAIAFTANSGQPLVSRVLLYEDGSVRRLADELENGLDVRWIDHGHVVVSSMREKTYQMMLDGKPVEVEPGVRMLTPKYASKFDAEFLELDRLTVIDVDSGERQEFSGHGIDVWQ